MLATTLGPTRESPSLVVRSDFAYVLLWICKRLGHMAWQFPLSTDVRPQDAKKGGRLCGRFLFV